MDTARRWFWPCLAFGLLVALPAAQAAVRDFYFQRLENKQGLVQNTVTALAQDAQGFIWIGTQGGLHRYDGQRLQTWRHDPRDPGSLPDGLITALAVEPGKAVWIGTYSQYVVRLDLHDGSFRRYKPLSDIPGNGHVRALLVQDGQVWVATSAGLEWIDPESGRRTMVLKLDPIKAAGSGAQALAHGRAGTVWYGNAAGLYRIDPAGRSRRVGLPGPVASLALDDRDQRLWVGRDDGLYRLSPDDQTLKRIWPAGGAAGAGPVTSIVQAPDGWIWASVASAGLLRLNPATGAVQRIRENPAIPASLPEDSVNTLLVDRSGQLWVGGQIRGLSTTDPRGANFTYLVDTPQANVFSPGGSSIRAITQADDGALWLGVDDNRLLRYDMQRNVFEDLTELLPATPDAPAPADDARIMGFAPAGPGQRWLATADGLMLLDTATRQVRRIRLPHHDPLRLRSIARDTHGGLWLGTNGQGILHYRPDTGRVIEYVHDAGTAGGLIHALHVDRRGRVWFGSSAGLGLLEPGAGQARRFRHMVNDPRSLAGDLVRAIHQGADGSLWVGTHAGLSRVRVEGGHVRFDHPLRTALGDQAIPTVYSIAESPDGTLWLGTNAGILRFAPAQETMQRYGVAEGLQDLEFNGGAVAELDDGRLAFGGIRGLNLFDPAQMHAPRFQPPLRLLATRIGNTAREETAILQQPGKLVVPGTADILRLRVGALDFSPTTDLHYRYRLEGFDDTWIDNGDSGAITYTQLPPGKYLFHAQVSSQGGPWSSTLRLPVVVQPPPWLHPLALITYALVALLLLGAIGWQWLRRQRRERGYFEQISEREERLKLALWASGEQFWDYDLEHRLLHWMRPSDNSGHNPEIGVVRTEVESEQEIHEDDLPQVRQRMVDHLRGASPLFLTEHRVRRPDGGWNWMRARGQVVERDDNGRVLRVAGTARDITISRRAERERRIASEVLRSMTEAVAVFDRDFNFVSVNPAFARMTGYTESEVIGQPTGILDSGQHDPDFYRRWQRELQHSGRRSGEMWQRRKDGHDFLCRLQSVAVLDANGERMHYVVVLSDITDEKRAEQELRYMASHDLLTNLPNRTLLSEHLAQAVVRARRQQTRVAVLFLDLDRFKDINDSLGHAAGDRILRAVASRVQETVGPQHMVARLGGDEFTVVLENLDSAEQAEQVAREVIDAFQLPLEVDAGQDASISPSIGISLYPDNAQGPGDLLKHADTAMYQAKAAGRRTYMRYAKSMDVDTRRRALVSGALRKALDRGELRLVFQPRLSLQHGRITGVEALLRWHNPEHGEIPPSQFIPLAEESGLILEIGQWALHQACATLSQWRHQGIDALIMSVNMSSLQLLRGNLHEVVAGVLDETGIPARCLELELTETMIMANAQQTMASLQAFRSLGVSLAIDDFGTGYSSLAYLKRLPITTLKIDKEFIGDLTRDPDDEAITSAVIALARSLELNVVAEGVENEAQMQFLREHGCHEVQGFWLSQPLAPERCLEFLRGWTPPAAP